MATMPNYRPAAELSVSCGSCRHYEPQAGYCRKYTGQVQQNYVCDGFAPLTVGTERLAKAAKPMQLTPMLGGGVPSKLFSNLSMQSGPLKPQQFLPSLPGMAGLPKPQPGVGQQQPQQALGWDTRYGLGGHFARLQAQPGTLPAQALNNPVMKTAADDELAAELMERLVRLLDGPHDKMAFGWLGGLAARAGPAVTGTANFLGRAGPAVTNFLGRAGPIGRTASNFVWNQGIVPAAEGIAGAVGQTGRFLAAAPGAIGSGAGRFMNWASSPATPRYGPYLANTPAAAAAARVVPQTFGASAAQFGRGIVDPTQLVVNPSQAIGGLAGMARGIPGVGRALDWTANLNPRAWTSNVLTGAGNLAGHVIPGAGRAGQFLANTLGWINPANAAAAAMAPLRAVTGLGAARNWLTVRSGGIPAFGRALGYTATAPLFMSSMRESYPGQYPEDPIHAANPLRALQAMWHYMGRRAPGDTTSPLVNPITGMGRMAEDAWRASQMPREMAARAWHDPLRIPRIARDVFGRAGRAAGEQIAAIDEGGGTGMRGRMAELQEGDRVEGHAAAVEAANGNYRRSVAALQARSPGQPGYDEAAAQVQQHAQELNRLQARGQRLFHAHTAVQQQQYEHARADLPTYERELNELAPDDVHGRARAQSRVDLLRNRVTDYEAAQRSLGEVAPTGEQAVAQNLVGEGSVPSARLQHLAAAANDPRLSPNERAANLQEFNRLRTRYRQAVTEHNWTVAEGGAPPAPAQTRPGTEAHTLATFQQQAATVLQDVTRGQPPTPAALQAHQQAMTAMNSFMTPEVMRSLNTDPQSPYIQRFREMSNGLGRSGAAIGMHNLAQMTGLPAATVLEILANRSGAESGAGATNPPGVPPQPGVPGTPPPLNVEGQRSQQFVQQNQPLAARGIAGIVGGLGAAGMPGLPNVGALQQQSPVVGLPGQPPGTAQLTDAVRHAVITGAEQHFTNNEGRVDTNRLTEWWHQSDPLEKLLVLGGMGVAVAGVVSAFSGGAMSVLGPLLGLAGVAAAGAGFFGHGHGEPFSKNWWRGALGSSPPVTGSAAPRNLTMEQAMAHPELGTVLSGQASQMSAQQLQAAAASMSRPAYEQWFNSRPPAEQILLRQRLEQRLPPANPLQGVRQLFQRQFGGGSTSGGSGTEGIANTGAGGLDEQRSLGPISSELDQASRRLQAGDRRAAAAIVSGLLSRNPEARGVLHRVMNNRTPEQASQVLAQPPYSIRVEPAILRLWQQSGGAL